MFKNILVISDNPPVCSRFFEIVGKKEIKNCQFTLSVSPFSNKDDFNISPATGILDFDLKNSKDIEQIVKNFDMVLSVHCKQIFPPELINKVKCINIHPGYNPINRGWYPQVFSIIQGLPVGATIHEIDEKLDHGGIIARDFVKKEIFDTSKTLYKKIVDKEMELVEIWLERIVAGDYSLIAPEEEGIIYFKKDYKKLLELDLNEKKSLGEFIDILRALSHEGFDNAYFLDPESRRRIFVEIKLKPEL